MNQQNSNDISTIRRATVWSAITSIVRKLLIPISNMILARILAPEVFGIVAIINVVISFADIFTDAGFQKYLIQHEFSDNNQLNDYTTVAFWTNFILSALIWLCFYSFRYPIAAFTGCEDYETHLVVAALSVPMTSFSSIQQALFKRNFDFKGMFIPNLVSAVIPLVITVPIAIIRKDCWALIIGSLAQRITEAILFSIKSNWKPRFFYSINILKAMFSFSAWTLFESLSIWLTLNVDVFITGKLLSNYYLGLYRTSITIVGQITSLLTAIVIPVLFSALSRSQNDEVQFKGLFYEFQRKSAVLLIPMSAGIMLYNDLITKILLGNQWSEAALFIGMLGLMQAPIIMIANYGSEVYRAKGEPKVSFIVQSLFIIISIPAYCYGASNSFMMLSICKILTLVLFVIMNAVVLIIRYNMSAVTTIGSFVQPSIATAGMILFSLCFSRLNNGIAYNFVGIILCIIIYVAICMFLPDTRKIIMEFVKKEKPSV